MLVLALDTTTRQGSAALARDGEPLATLVGDAGVAHGVRLPGDLMRLLDAHGLAMADVDLFAVAAGPGSFTGLRIGIATMQGLALANDKPLAGISALDAIHAAVSSHRSDLNSDSEVAVWMDAQRGQVFSAVYTRSGAAEIAVVDAPSEILARWFDAGRRPALFAGDGAVLYREFVHDAHGNAEIVDPIPALAPSIARLAETQVRQHGAQPPDAIRPIYVRRPDVELARDRAAAARR